jgi:hypothetical protein
MPDDHPVDARISDKICPQPGSHRLAVKAWTFLFFPLSIYFNYILALNWKKSGETP